MVGTIPLIDLAWPDDFGAINPGDSYQTAEREIFAPSAPERMHSRATLGVPLALLDFGGVPLSRVEDTVWRNAPDFVGTKEYGADRAATGTWDGITPSTRHRRGRRIRSTPRCGE
jgi:hypothetical protein